MACRVDGGAPCHLASTPSTQDCHDAVLHLMMPFARVVRIVFPVAAMDMVACPCRWRLWIQQLASWWRRRWAAPRQQADFPLPSARTVAENAPVCPLFSQPPFMRAFSPVAALSVLLYPQKTYINAVKVRIRIKQDFPCICPRQRFAPRFSVFPFPGRRLSPPARWYRITTRPCCLPTRV